MDTRSAEQVTVIPWLDRESAKVIQVHAGQVYEFVRDVSCRSGFVHPGGSFLHVVDSTKATPHGEIGPCGHNWVCKTQYDVSVWATLEHCIERGLLRKVKPS